MESSPTSGLSGDAPVAEGFEALPLHARSRAALASLAATGLPGASLVILECPQEAAAQLAATALATALLSPEAAARDIHLAAPEGDRWSVEELDELVARPSFFVAQERTVIVVASASATTVPAAEHLLKTVEEPAGETLFLFCVSDAAQLLPTLRGRAAHILSLQPATGAERAALLAAAHGIEPELAERVVALAGADVVLASALAAHLSDSSKDPEILEVLSRVRAHELGAPTPTLDAVSMVVDLVALAQLRREHLRPEAALASGRKPRKAPARKKAITTKDLDPAGRAALRDLVREQLAWWEEGLLARVRAASSSAELVHVERSLTALGLSRTELERFTPPTTVLAALLSRSG